MRLGLHTYASIGYACHTINHTNNGELCVKPQAIHRRNWLERLTPKESAAVKSAIADVLERMEMSRADADEAIGERRGSRWTDQTLNREPEALKVDRVRLLIDGLMNHFVRQGFGVVPQLAGVSSMLRNRRQRQPIPFVASDEALDELAERFAELLRCDGVNVSPALTRRLARFLRAAALDGAYSFRAEVLSRMERRRWTVCDRVRKRRVGEPREVTRRAMADALDLAYGIIGIQGTGKRPGMRDA